MDKPRPFKVVPEGELRPAFCHRCKFACLVKSVKRDGVMGWEFPLKWAYTPGKGPVCPTCNETKAESPSIIRTGSGEFCPRCGHETVRTGSCLSCPNCFLPGPCG